MSAPRGPGFLSVVFTAIALVSCVAAGTKVVFVHEPKGSIEHLLHARYFSAICLFLTRNKWDDSIFVLKRKVYVIQQSPQYTASHSLK